VIGPVEREALTIGPRLALTIGLLLAVIGAAVAVTR
jgi:hypothetical protein